jgi:hypothetical protein
MVYAKDIIVLYIFVESFYVMHCRKIGGLGSDSTMCEDDVLHS